MLWKINVPYAALLLKMVNADIADMKQSSRPLSIKPPHQKTVLTIIGLILTHRKTRLIQSIFLQRTILIMESAGKAELLLFSFAYF